MKGVSTAHDAGPLHRLADRMDVQGLVDRYLAGLDDARFDDDWARSVFTEQGSFRFAAGGHDGVAGMAEFTAAMMRKWRRTHHVAAGHLIDLDGDRAHVRGNLIATHVHPHDENDIFQAGDRFHGEAVRTGAGWRFAWLSFEVVWTRGTPAARIGIDGR